MSPRKMASDLKMPWHNLVHFGCARFCHCNFCLFLTPPPPPCYLDALFQRGPPRRKA